MTVNPVNAISVSEEITSPRSVQPKNFAQWLEQSMASANEHIAQSEHLTQLVAVGNEANVHQVMIALEKAKLSFDLVLQIRNRLLEGYQQIMREQI